ncbi:hypothetical protein SH449x_001853 [Pirellulaceae bacterium SH449]
MNALVEVPETELLDLPYAVEFESEPSNEELATIRCPLALEAGGSRRIVDGDNQQPDWFELALQTEAPTPVRNAWDDDDDDVEDEPAEDDEEVVPESEDEPDPFDDFDEEDFDDDFDDDFEEELDDEYEIEPKDDGFPVESDDDDDVDPDLTDTSIDDV